MCDISNICCKCGWSLEKVMKCFPDHKNLCGKDGKNFFKAYEKWKCPDHEICICQAWIGCSQVEHEHLRDDFTNVQRAVKFKKGVKKIDVAMLITMAHILDVPNYYYPYLQKMREMTGETEQEG